MIKMQIAWIQTAVTIVYVKMDLKATELHASMLMNARMRRTDATQTQSAVIPKGIILAPVYPVSQETVLIVKTRTSATIPRTRNAARTRDV